MIALRQNTEASQPQLAWCRAAGHRVHRQEPDKVSCDRRELANWPRWDDERAATAPEAEVIARFFIAQICGQMSMGRAPLTCYWPHTLLDANMNGADDAEEELRKIHLRW